MIYTTFEFLIRTAHSAEWIEVIAISKDAAIADLESAYVNLDILQWSQK